MIQIILFYMEIIQLNLCLMRDFNNTNVIKYNNADYDPWLEKETGSFCHPSQDWYSSWSVVKMIRREAFPMSEDEILEGFHVADDYDSHIYQ